MLHLSTILMHYKRPEIQRAILENARSREVGVKYGDKGFGKRPDVLTFPQDVLQFAQNGLTSFHISEEIWTNPLNIKTGMSRKELDDIRTGWDLVIDIDFEEWEATKIITAAVIDALHNHNITTISCKFSGNKGFHIGVPFKAFPVQIHGKETRTWFPDGPKRVAEYLAHYIDRPENSFQTSTKLLSLPAVRSMIKDPTSKVGLMTICVNCAEPISLKESTLDFICPKCDSHLKKESDTKYALCPKCSSHMQKVSLEKKQACSRCDGTVFTEKVNLKIDTMLVSSRHLYRSVYSLHEKSGLASIPVDPYAVMGFERESASPLNLEVSTMRFLDDANALPGEASILLQEAFDFRPKEEEKEKNNAVREFESFETKTPEEFFPPCIKLILEGVQEGRKRSVFVLQNFLSSVGWSHDEIEKLLTEWNTKNPEPLRETILKGSLRYKKQKRKSVLPPNCENMMYYKDFGVCKPDNLCRYIKNPVQYVRRKTESLPKKKNAKKTKKPSRSVNSSTPSS